MNTNTTQTSNSLIPAPIAPLVSNIQNESNEGVILVQHNLNTPPEIQEGLAAAAGNFLAEEAVPQQNQDALDDAALVKAKNKNVDEKKRMQAAESIQNVVKRDEAYSCIALSVKVADEVCVEAAEKITDQDIHDSVLLHIATDLYNNLATDARLEAAEKIADCSIRDKVFFTIALNPKIDSIIRVEAALKMSDKIESNKLLYLLAINPKVNEYMRLQAVKYITEENKQNIRNDIIMSIAENTTDNDIRQEAANLIKNCDQKKKVLIRAISDILKDLNKNLRRTLIEVLNFINEIEEDEFRDEILKETYQGELFLLDEKDLDDDSKEDFSELCNLAFLKNTRKQFIIAMMDNTKFSKEFLKQIIESNIEDSSEKETLLSSIERGIPLKGSNTKGAHK